VFDGEGNIDCGGRYEGDHIISCPISGPPKNYAHFIAHEMGHHIYRVYLSEADHDFWSAAVGQDYAEADLNDLLAEWREGEWSLDVVERLSQTDPVKALQISGLTIYGHLGDTRDDVVKYLEEHGPRVRVPTHPITGYSTKSSEEAFCEAVGMLVGYGPRAVDPMVLGWLKTILPREIRVAAHVGGDPCP
jgi:hypothetical protein